ncbi:phosphate signaling complex protein PhoU [Apilactobacillus ozensis]|uniref:Phosphate-specific transport system accessory protein PhoU n=1 Tax=Apilactobacillus ozensis DSM 23829 = JCM 17196 TaxID=1423781 RepID=A0A0R2AXF1_9LACO|nr:phosphate signaling complex protein PhoU [Apilactobacillus ozensis]KRM68326.1 phosphate regulatory protein [Apilactobacillus ozensis DSM 23829 = JCM 17196]MCK8607484.1 phosphate signaling complex protein PhoU [Apilactobacillus ozensis]
MAKTFTEELKKLQNNFISMGVDVNEEIYQATKLFLSSNHPDKNIVSKQDKNVNQKEVNLEEQALNLIALQQPVANDFREIICILKASSDLERIGDHAASIANEAVHLKAVIQDPDVERIITQMSLKVRTMLESFLNSYYHNDSYESKVIAQEDILVDKYFVQARKLIMQEAEEHDLAIDALYNYLRVIRLLERIGDHIVNLTEWVLYRNSGELVELNPGKIEPDLVRRDLEKNGNNGLIENKDSK